MKRLYPLAALAAALIPLAADAQDAYPATLAGHAILPAMSMIAAPHDAPADLKSAGKFTTGQRVEAIGSVEGASAGRPTGIGLPFKGQPAQPRPLQRDSMIRHDRPWANLPKNPREYLRSPRAAVRHPDVINRKHCVNGYVIRPGDTRMHYDASARRGQPYHQKDVR